MSHNGCIITDIKSKANVFINHYARVSKLNMSWADWDLNRKFKKGLNAPSADDEICASVQIGQLLSVIKNMKCKGAAGPDKVPSSFLKSLNPLTLHKLVSIFNSSFSIAHFPRIWKIAKIILSLKARKSSSEVTSFRPNSLTSCVAKLLEHILADRLITESAKPKICSAHSKLDFVKVGAAKIKLLV